MGGRYKPIAFWCLMKTSHTGQILKKLYSTITLKETRKGAFLFAKKLSTKVYKNFGSS